MRRELYSWQGLERGSHMPGGYGRAVIEARMQAGWWGVSCRHPAIEMHQSSA